MELLNLRQYNYKQFFAIFDIVLNPIIMTKYKLLIAFLWLIMVFFISCKKDEKISVDEANGPGIKTISGKAQKGPYKNGASLIIYELNNSLGQTGKSFSSIINDDAGNFSFNNINLSSNYVLLTATGYYFNEHFNKISEGQLYLESFADVSNISTVNINLLTHIIKPRIEELASTGLDFNSSRIQAQNELLTVMGSNAGVSGNFETFDLSGNGFLLAMSLLFQRNNSFGYQMGYNYTAELSSLLSNFRSDFANNGVIDNSNIIDTLVYNAQRIDLVDCKSDLQNYYSGLGLNFSGNGFEQYIYNFQKKYTPVLSNNIIYQDSATIMIDAPMAAPPYSYRDNILKMNKTQYNTTTHQYVISAIVPYDSTLIIKCTPFNVPYPLSNFGGGNFGWKYSFNSGVYIYEAQRKNVVLSAFLDSASDSIKVEYFNNSSSTIPYYTKNVVF